MEIRFQTEKKWNTDLALFYVFEDQTQEDIEKKHKELFEKASFLQIAPAWRDFKGKKKTIQVIYGHKDNEISRACVIGLGKKEKFNLETLRHATGIAIRACRETGFEHIGLSIESIQNIANELSLELPYITEEICTAALSSLYRYTTWKTDNKELMADPKALVLLLTDKHVPDALQKAARLAEATNAGLQLSRDLSNSPANILTPEAFAEQALFVAKKYDFKCKILEQEEMAAENMNAFLAVAKGSVNTPRCIILEYTPKNCTNTKPYIFVGKGLTFDSGGISLKPSKGMEEMKTDMSGAADILGLFEMLGQAKNTFEPNRPIIGMLGCAENMPDGGATKPGDVVYTLKGKTVEITNTDAEGRLVLIDVLAYAQKYYDPEVLIDIATLTGACIVAIGEEAAGLFSNNGKLAHSLLDCSEKVGETLWRLPLWENMLKKLESQVADLNNAGPREGGALSAATFIQQFIDEKTVWAHIDIAGPNCSYADTPLCPKGGTGFGLRTLGEFVKKAPL